MRAVDFPELNLAPLPVEGGRFAPSHRDDLSSAIYYLLRAPEFSALHQLDRTEIFVFHAGAPARMLLLHRDGTVTRPLLGVGDGARPQVVVPPYTWQATETTGAYTLMGTIVVPPYTDDCVRFDAPAPADYPDAAADIARLTAR